MSRWRDIVATASDTAFAHAQKADPAFIGELRELIDTAIAFGTTLGDFRDAFDALLDRSAERRR